MDRWNRGSRFPRIDVSGDEPVGDFEVFVTSNKLDPTPRPPPTAAEIDESMKYRKPVWLVSRELASAIATMEKV